MITDLAIRVIKGGSYIYLWLLLEWTAIADWFYYRLHTERDHEPSND